MLCSLAKKDKFVPSTNDGILHLDKGIANEPPCRHQECEQPILLFFLLGSLGLAGLGLLAVYREFIGELCRAD